MWKLKSTTKDDLEFSLICNKDLIVGRRDVDIVISGDSSVSRKHATIRVAHQLENLKNPEALPVIHLEDSSKFGTHLTRQGGKKVNEKVTLSDGDTVQFGAQHSIFKVSYTPLVITTSMLENDMKTKLQETVLTLGGHMVNNWHDKVTHVVIAEIKLSIKVTQALAHLCHIVTPDFVFKLAEMTQSNKSELNPENFLPELAESNLSKEHCSFKVNEKRKQIFLDRTFLYFSKKQIKRLGTAITYGGGRVLMIENEDVDDKLIADSNVGVVQCTPAEKDPKISDKTYEHVKNILAKNQKRFIQEHEIGLAVLYCDASVYCNPHFDLNSQNTFTQCPFVTESVDNRDNAQSVQTSSHASHATLTDRSTKKRQREDEIAQKSSSDKEDVFVDLTQDEFPETGDAMKKKKPKLSEVFGQSSNATAQRLNKVETLASASTTRDVVDLDSDEDMGQKTSDNKCPKEKDEDVLEDIPDSYLADDSLWSQNFDSQSVPKQTDTITQNRERPKTPSKSRSSAQIGTVAQTNSEAIKAEIKSPAPLSKFPSARSEDSQARVKLELRSPSSGMGNDKDNHPGTEVPKSDIQEDNERLYAQYVANVIVASLVSAKKRHTINLSSHNRQGVKNFKRFQKVWPTYMKVQGIQTDSAFSLPVLPRIIGGSDFFEHHSQTNMTSNMMDWLGNERGAVGESNYSEDESNPFNDL